MSGAPDFTSRPFSKACTKFLSYFRVSSVFVSTETKKAVEEDFEKRGPEAFYEELQKKDPEYASQIHPNDSYRLMRAFEILRSGIKTVSQIKTEFEQKPPPFPTLLIGLKREKKQLKDAIERRTEGMLKDGLVEETQGLLRRYPQGLRALGSVGYKETVEFLKSQTGGGPGGVGAADGLKAAIVKSTMLLAKRQNTWFKRDPRIQWFDTDEGLTKSRLFQILPQ